MYMYIYIYIEGNKKRERRGEEEAPPPETMGESQRHNDSDGVSESENKRQEKTLKVMCFMDSKNKPRERIFFIAHVMLPVIGALVQGEGPEDGYSRAVRDFFGMSCVLEKFYATPKILYVYRQATAVTSRLSLWVFLGNLHVRGSCKLRHKKRLPLRVNRDNWATITPTSSRWVASNSLWYLGHPFRRGLRFVPKTLFVFVIFGRASRYLFGQTWLYQISLYRSHLFGTGLISVWKRVCWHSCAHI